MHVQSAIALLLLATTLTLAQICPPESPANKKDYAHTRESLVFPVSPSGSGSGGFNVTDYNNDWILMLTAANLQVVTSVDSSYEYLDAYLVTTLVNKHNGAGYSVVAGGPISFLSLRATPDYRWLTLQNIWIPGVAEPSLSFNVSISYADFWTDSPADNIFELKHEEVYPGTECTFKYAESGGNNLIQNKNFWIQFSFANGSQISFNIPQGYPSSYYRFLYAGFYTNCDCLPS